MEKHPNPKRRISVPPKSGTIALARPASRRAIGATWRSARFSSRRGSRPPWSGNRRAAGAAALNDYARSNDPFTKVGRQQIAVDVSSVIRASPDSFQVAWTERRYENGQLADTTRWRAILTIVVQIPRNADRLRANPLGIYVNAISWSRELGQ